MKVTTHMIRGSSMGDDIELTLSFTFDAELTQYLDQWREEMRPPRNRIRTAQAFIDEAVGAAVQDITEEFSDG